MSDDKPPKGPGLGGGGPSLGGPKSPSSGGGPKGPSLGGPSTGGPSPKSKSDSPKKVEKKKKRTSEINVHELVRRWGVIRRRIRDSLQTLMLREIKEKVAMTSVNEVFRRNVNELFDGHLAYFKEMIELIEDGLDELSLELAENRKDVKVSDTVFRNLSEIIEEELKFMEQEKPVITEYIDEDLKRFRDARVEPRASFWVIWYTALMIREIRERSEEKLEIVLDVLMRYPAAQRRTLGVYLNFCDCLITNFQPFPVEFARIGNVYNPTNTGYNMAPWIKPRFDTYSQDYMTYDRFLEYYARSFGSVPGNSPEFEGGAKDGYRKWLQRTLTALEDRMRTSPLLMEHARGNTLEGMLVGLEDQLNEAKKNLEFDDDGKVTNHPPGIEGAAKFVNWLFHTALNRYTTTNISTHSEARLSLDMFDFIEKTVRWVNEYGEMIVMDWLSATPDSDETSTEE